MNEQHERILTTHTGSLPRPARLLQLLLARENGETDRVALESEVTSAVAEIVRTQIAAGVDIVNDGEMGKIGYSTYVKDRLTGFEGESIALGMAQSTTRLTDLADFPDFAARFLENSPARSLKMPACNGPISYKGRDELRLDLDNLRAALGGISPADTFMSAASPGVISLFLQNTYYPNREAYIADLAAAMKTEYDAINRAGFMLQLDCPDLAMGRHIQFGDQDLAEFRRNAVLNVEALNHATRDIPPDRMRMHLCWGNYEGPHHRDVALGDIIDIVLRARPSMISLEAANPRHAHEWKLFEDVKLPDGKKLIPGVLDSTTNFIEHPELVAQRILNYARVVGRDRVIAGTDCGFATFAGLSTVDPQITWAKFRALAEGARLASAELWKKSEPAPKAGASPAKGTIKRTPASSAATPRRERKIRRKAAAKTSPRPTKKVAAKKRTVPARLKLKRRRRK
jgi:5-methyltetrahydropteroyltriglutamate--homocysteine methyltransferase